MKFLEETLATVKHYGFTVSEIIGKENKKNGKLWAQMLEGVEANKWKTEDDAAMELYGTLATDDRYRHTKERLRKRLLSLVLQIDPDKSFPSPKKTAGYEIMLKLSQAEILRRENAMYAAVELYEQIYRAATKFYFSYYVLHAVAALEHIWGQLGNTERMELYRSEYCKWYVIIADEAEANRLKRRLDEFTMKTSSITPEMRAQIPAIVAQLTNIADRSPTEVIVLQNYRARLANATFHRDYHEALAAITQVKKFFDSNDYLITKALQQEFDYQEFYCLLHLRRLDEARRAVERGLKNVNPVTTQWELLTRGEAQLGLHSGDYEVTARALDKLLKFKYGTQRKDVTARSRMVLLHGYFAYAILIEEINPSKHMKEIAAKFDIYEFLKQTNLTKDKTGDNVAIIVLRILFLLEESNIEETLTKSESLRKYRQTHLKDPQFLRAASFMRSLQILLELDYNIPSTERKAKRYIEEMNSSTLEGFEPVPWDKLWAIVLRYVRRLKRK